MHISLETWQLLRSVSFNEYQLSLLNFVPISAKAYGTESAGTPNFSLLLCLKFSLGTWP